MGNPHAATSGPPPSDVVAPRPESRPLNWLMLVAGVILAGLGLTLTGAGLFLTVADASQRDGQYAYTDTDRLHSVGNAIITAPIALDLGESTTSGAFGIEDVVSVQLRAAPAVPGQEVFIGIADAADVDAYLQDVPHAVMGDQPWDSGIDVGTTGWMDAPDPNDALDEVSGTRTAAPPTDQDFWAQSATGPDQQTLTVEFESGEWVVVVMNADGTRPVLVDLQAGAHTELFGMANTVVLTAGLVALVLGLPLILFGAAGLGRDIDRGLGHGPAGGAPVALAGPDPLRLTGHLDPQISRGMWLIKWLLAIPHYIVMAILWFALVVVTIVSGFVILFTGRYPRAWFLYSVGVLRWNWRVGFYAYAVLGTDRYPPFTLARTDYPADLDVVYPERLSRGLVLVKWWLLAVPHLLLVGIFTGSGAAVASTAASDSSVSWGFSLLGLLVLIAAIGLLFTGRYLPGLFALNVGLNRWVNRVNSYVLLLRDEYPPFRLDQGPEEPVWSGSGHTPPSNAAGGEPPYREQRR